MMIKELAKLQIWIAREHEIREADEVLNMIDPCLKLKDIVFDTEKYKKYVKEFKNKLPREIAEYRLIDYHYDEYLKELFKLSYDMVDVTEAAELCNRHKGSVLQSARRGSIKNQVKLTKITLLDKNECVDRYLNNKKGLF